MLLTYRPTRSLQQLLLLIGLVLATQTAQAIEVGDYLPLGTVQTIQGQTFDQAHWNQKNTLVHVWATWCGFCHKQNANLSQLIKKIPPGSMNIVTISVDKKVEKVHDYLAKHRYDFDVVMMDAKLSSAIGKRRGVPELYILDRQGRVIQKDYGLMVDVDFFDLSKYSKSSSK
jgi:thiol-disulfide isomerase/thioredoxin